MIRKAGKSSPAFFITRHLPGDAHGFERKVFAGNQGMLLSVFPMEGAFPARGIKKRQLFAAAGIYSSNNKYAGIYTECPFSWMRLTASLARLLRMHSVSLLNPTTHARGLPDMHFRAKASPLE